MNVLFQELARSYGLSKRAVNATRNDLMPDKRINFSKSFVEREPFSLSKTCNAYVLSRSDDWFWRPSEPLNQNHLVLDGI